MNIKHLKLNSDKSILVTGGAGFIGSNLCESILENGNKVRCLDNLSTGKKTNIEKLLAHPNFEFVEGDITTLETCMQACTGIDFVLHQAALGSVPRSINNPMKTNEVNISGFLNMLWAVKESGVKRMVYAASSSTYGDSKSLPKVEDVIGKPLSPYAVTKYVNELYADVFAKTFGIETIGLRYFNVFGRKQDPNGAYAAVIPKFVMTLMKHESPTINGDGNYSRDFTYIDNVIEMNIRSIVSEDKNAVNQIYNVACGDRTTIQDLFDLLVEYLGEYDPAIKNIEPKYGKVRDGDVPHSLASIDKAKSLLGYDPQFDFKIGLKEAVDWYWSNLKQN
ncbi:SDR family oxidoreductase [Flagellimonas beolgyonensis]|uniref:SDR family oxidoreductase n=1 Tax=Flagellimonas beolgyonensis TaxID=864064 RepID=UPI000F8CACB7|nr:SDR family oxidoreductase [Allomuricauda beolgyonensis]